MLVQAVLKYWISDKRRINIGAQRPVASSSSSSSTGTALLVLLFLLLLCCDATAIEIAQTAVALCCSSVLALGLFLHHSLIYSVLVFNSSTAAV